MIGLIAAVAGAAAAIGAVSLTNPVSTADRTAIEKVIRDYILEHPEILPEAMERLQARETAKVVNANRKQIETPYAGAWEGAANADVTLVEFFDYACGYCKASLPDIARLLKDDPKLKIVYREFPVLGPDSEAAAHLSLAAAQAGKYAAFHRALYAAGRPDENARKAVARAFGLDAKASETPESTAEIAQSFELQQSLRLTGTPAFIVGDRILSGAVGYEALKAAIDEARAKEAKIFP